MNGTTTEGKIEIYEMLLDLVEEKAKYLHITDEELKEYFEPEGIVKKQNYLERLASSLQNSGQMHNSIRFNESDIRYELIRETLFDFDCKKALKQYNRWEDLYNALIDKGIIDRGAKRGTEKKKTNWGKYARGLYKGMQYLENNGKNEIDDICKEPLDIKDLNKKIKKLKEIASEIHGLGFALTCDWIKECGATWLAKPDTHIKKVCSVIDGKDEDDLLSDTEIIKFVFKFANDIKETYNDVTAYKLDKIIWLICTGNFYLQNDKRIGRDTILANLKK